MNGYSALVLKIAGFLLAGGVAWGALNSEVSGLNERMSRIEQKMDSITDMLLRWSLGNSQ